VSAMVVDVREIANAKWQKVVARCQFNWSLSKTVRSQNAHDVREGAEVAEGPCRKRKASVVGLRLWF
jgi:hypothetical protein